MQYVVEPRITAVEVILIYETGSPQVRHGIRQGLVTPSVKTILTVPLTFVPCEKKLLCPIASRSWPTFTWKKRLLHN